MQLTRSADYAIRVMIHLSGVPAGTRVNRDTLARWSEVPGEFLGKVLQTLARGRLIISHRGVHGGFELARASNSISLLDIVEAIEGPLQLNVCLVTGEGCARSWWCPAHEVWKDAQSAMAGVLASARLDRLAEKAKSNLESRNVIQIQSGGSLWS